MPVGFHSFQNVMDFLIDKNQSYCIPGILDCIGIEEETLIIELNQFV
jgi:hypothetical protein